MTAELTWPLFVPFQDLYRMMVEHDDNDIFIRQRPELVGLWLEVCQAISRQLSWAKMHASTRLCLGWFYAHLSCTRAGLICCGSRMVPVHISHVLVNVAKHHICSAGRTSTLGQQSCNYKIFKYSKKFWFSKISSQRFSKLLVNRGSFGIRNFLNI